MDRANAIDPNAFDVHRLIRQSGGVATWDRIKRLRPHKKPTDLSAAITRLERDGRIVIFLGANKEILYVTADLMEAWR